MVGIINSSFTQVVGCLLLVSMLSNKSELCLRNLFGREGFLLAGH